MTAAPYPRLLGDFGGTHARVATVARRGDPLQAAIYPSADFDGVGAVLSHHLATWRGPRPAACAIGVAGPIAGDMVRLTNLGWTFSIAALGRDLGVDRFEVLNDFEALARSLPSLTGSDLMAIGGDVDGARGTRALLGPGTGLGMSALVEAPGGPVAIAGEGGHAALAATDEVEDRILALLRPRFGRVSAERVLSGPGLVNLHAALAEIAGERVLGLTAEEIGRRALDGSDPRCAEAVQRFLGWLGAVAGDAALAFGAHGGVYIGGGIVPRLLPLLEEAGFRRRFEDKGRYRAYLAAIPVFVMLDASLAALRGADAALELDTP